MRQAKLYVRPLQKDIEDHHTQDFGLPNEVCLNWFSNSLKGSMTALYLFKCL